MVHYFRITSTYLYSFQFAGRRCHLRLQKLRTCTGLNEDIRTEAHTRREALLPVFLVETLLIVVFATRITQFVTTRIDFYRYKQISILF